MHIAVDVRHLCTPQPTGIGYYTLEILPSLLADTSIQWTLFASGGKRALRHFPKQILDLAASLDHVTIHLHREPNRLLNAKLLLGKTSLDELVASPVDAWFFPNINFIHTSKPYVITAHDLSFSILPECYSRKTRAWHSLVDPVSLYKNASRVLAVSHSTKTDLQTLYEIPEKRISVTPLGVSSAFHPKEEARDRNALRSYGISGDYLLTLCTLEPRKNHLGMIQGYERWREENPHKRAQYVIVGGRGYQSRLVLRTVRKSPYSSDILYIPYINGQDRACFMRHAKGFLFCSLYEGFGLPVLESLSCGTPVLTSNLSALLEHGGNSVLHIHPWHIDEISDGISHILDLPAYGPGSRFSGWTSAANETLSAFKKLF